MSRKVQARKPKPAAPAATKPETPLTAMQELLLDMAGDLIMNGGSRNEYEPLIRTLLRHNWRLMFPERCGADLMRGAEDWEESRYEEWSRKYLAALPETPKRAGCKLPADISERIRFNVRAEIDEEMLEFRGNASWEELGLLREILIDWRCEGGNLQAGDEIQEIVLAKALYRQVTRKERHYIRVPKALISVVEKMAELQDTRASRQEIEEECA